MRYQEGIEIEPPAAGVNENLLIGTVSYALLLGLGMVAAGYWGRQRWIAFWGLTLVLAAAAYLIVSL